MHTSRRSEGASNWERGSVLTYQHMAAGNAARPKGRGSGWGRGLRFEEDRTAGGRARIRTRAPVGLVGGRGFSLTKCRGRCWRRENLTRGAKRQP